MTEHFTTTKYGDEATARKARDTRARALRKTGLTVACKRWDFTDLARAIDYTLEYVPRPTISRADRPIPALAYGRRLFFLGKRAPACEACDCADPTALSGLAAECGCACHRPA